MKTMAREVMRSMTPAVVGELELPWSVADLILYAVPWKTTAILARS
jgi:hypothetical protein